MGKVTTEIELRNHYDEVAHSEGKCDHIRQIQIEDAIVDSGATMLSLNTATIESLGLREQGIRKVNTADGIKEARVFGLVRLTIGDRSDIFPVMELLHPKIRVLVGQVPLGMFDLLIHPGVNRLIPNPFHENQLVLDQLLWP